MARIGKELETLRIPIFAKFDHGKNAEEVDWKLRPNQIVVLGLPKVGQN